MTQSKTVKIDWNFSNKCIKYFLKIRENFKASGLFSNILTDSFLEHKFEKIIIV